MSDFLILSVVLLTIIFVIAIAVIVINLLARMVREQWMATREENKDLRLQLLSHSWQEYGFVKQETTPVNPTKRFIEEPIVDITDDDVYHEQLQTFLEAVGENIEGASIL